MAGYFSAKELVTLTAHDTNPLGRRPEQVIVGVGGNAVVRAQGSSADVTFTGLVAGQVLPISIAYLRATGTTATLIGMF